MKHLFFDLDRTLWDFEKNSETALRILFKDYNLEDIFKSFEAFHKTYKKINSQLWYQYGIGNLSKEELRIKRFKDTLKRYKSKDEKLAINLGEGYVNISPHQTNLFPAAIKTLDSLKSDGFSLHIITNGFKEVQYIKLEKSKLIDFFDVIVCSEEVGKNKPALDVFQYAMKHASAKPKESIMIGDDLRVDVIGAQKAGMQGVLFDPHKEYKEGSHEWHINHLEEIPGIIPWIAKSIL